MNLNFRRKSAGGVGILYSDKYESSGIGSRLSDSSYYFKGTVKEK